MSPQAATPERETLHWGWIGAGAAVMLALSIGVHLAVSAVAGGAGPEVSRRFAWVYLLALVVAFVSGGAIVGRLSPGNTMKESAVSGAIAVGALAVISLVSGRGQGFEAVLLAGAAGFMLALLGGWLGEKLQGTI